MAIYTTGNELPKYLAKVNSSYFVLQYTASDTNLSKIYPISHINIALKDFNGEFGVSLLPFDAIDDQTALQTAIKTLGRHCIVWGPNHIYNYGSMLKPSTFF